MEAARRGLVVQPSPLPPSTSHAPRAHLRKTAFSSCSVFHGQASHAVSSTPLTSVVRHFPASILLQEQPDDLRSYPVKDDKASQVTLDGRCMETEESGSQDKDDDFDEYLKHFERQFLYSPGYWYPLPKHMEAKTSLSESINFIISDTVIEVKSEEQDVVKDNVIGLLPEEVLALAKDAVLASQEAASLVESHSLAAHIHGFRLGLGPKNSATEHIRVEQATVKSKRFLERQSKRRWTPKKATTVINNSTTCSVSAELSKKIGKGLDANAPLRMFLWGPETKQLLTVKEERDLFNKVQDLMRLEEVKQKLHLQFGREPTLSEWAEAVGLTCHALQSRLYVGNRSREKMIYANFRLVVHVAKQYQGKGLNIQDLLQEGSMGLMWSLEKFKPKAGCRFPTYAYWWIRQSIRKAIFQNSRTIRLPENVYALLRKIRDVRKLYLQEGHVPTSEELARRVGITKERLEGVLASSRIPVSIQNCAWKDQDVTVQEVTADPKVEAPEFSVAKQMMRQHVRNLLGVLSPRERRILQLRYGIGGGGGEGKSLSEIGAVFGLSKERVRQLESRAMDRLKEHHASQGLGAYVDLLV